ncbi:hypothetical protein [Paenibacillus harenae]|uniref:hypothetical protein n=1 Tax=Paenibacillus harenae TaxID=306543 RepID=UPI00279421C8|nr:hypothetical protein [Paenibacillus harenae]MDQ0062881.1 hypothetical protein [Paenibacillus harenae]
MNPLPLPKRFDANEWSIILSLAAGYAALFLPRRLFPFPVSLLIVLFGITVPKLFDATLAVPPFELYDINDYPKLELMDVALHLVYGPFAYFFIYGYARFRIRGPSTIAWIVCCSLLGVGIEWLGTLVGVYTHKNWNLLYSFFVYGCLQGLLLVFSRLWLRSWETTKKRA